MNSDPKALLVTRRGRCGEWANTFGVVLRAMGLETRYILDLTDHVWIEFYSNIENRWIHVDPCENAFDTPLLYETGWGKKLNYVFAFGDYEIKDVTCRYTIDFMQLLPRRNLAGESRLILFLEAWTRKLRQSISDATKKELESRDSREFLVKKELDWDRLIPRQSGSLEWRLARGEMGNQ